MPKTAIRIGPEDNGQTMTLKDFDKADGKPGFTYELSRGVLVVSDVPKYPHFAQIDTARGQFESYRILKPGRIFRIGGGAECKMLITGFESERHPDLSIYLEPPLDEKDIWSTWIPALVLEIVSRGSEHRDYEEKREEYLLFGVREYWILDANKGEMLVLQRRGGTWTEQTVRPPKLYQTPLLPGFKFSCGKVFQAAKKDQR